MEALRLEDIFISAVNSVAEASGMTSGAAIPTLCRKELRAMTPVFVATLALVPLLRTRRRARA